MDPALAAETLALSKQKALREALQRGDSAVSAFYKDSVVFITGGSGFLGKQLVEKLFRCTDVSKIYLLLRGKRGKSSHERLEEILNDPVYSTLHTESPDFKKKIVAVEGDVSQLKIGLSEDDWQTLSNEVNVIFHVAATVNFEEPILNATLTNVRGAREVVKLAKCCKHLWSIVHVSTAFAHATRSRVKSEVLEEFYKSPVAPEELIRLAEASNNERLEEIRNNFLGDWPNTYTFTKAVGEEVIRQMGKDLPICIVRPAIVVAAFREPTPGWVDENNVYGASGLILGVTMGIIHTMQAESGNHIDLVPVDLVNNALVVAAWETAQSDQLKIYTVTNTRNPGTWDTLINTLQEDVRELISPRTVWYCGGQHTRHRTLYLLLACLLHYIPACIADACLMLIGKKARFLKLYQKVTALSTVLSYFLMNDWLFRDDNLQQLYKKLSTTDHDLYNFDMSSVDYKELIIMWHLGIRKFIVKDGLKDTQYGIKKQKWLKLLTIILFPIYLYCLYQIFCVFGSALYFTLSYLIVLLGVSSDVLVSVAIL